MGNRNSSPPQATAADIQRASAMSAANTAALASSIVERIPIQSTTNTIQNTLNQVYNPVHAPTFNYSATTYDKELSDDTKIILRVLFSSLTSGATAYALDMNPLFYAAIGGVLSESRLKLNLNHLSSIGGATGISYFLKGDNIIKSGIAIGMGCYGGDLIGTTRLFNGDLSDIRMSHSP